MREAAEGGSGRHPDLLLTASSCMASRTAFEGATALSNAAPCFLSSDMVHRMSDFMTLPLKPTLLGDVFCLFGVDVAPFGSAFLLELDSARWLPDEKFVGEFFDGPRICVDEDYIKDLDSNFKRVNCVRTFFKYGLSPAEQRSFYFACAAANLTELEKCLAEELTSSQYPDTI